METRYRILNNGVLQKNTGQNNNFVNAYCVHGGEDPVCMETCAAFEVKDELMQNGEGLHKTGKQIAILHCIKAEFVLEPFEF